MVTLNHAIHQFEPPLHALRFCFPALWSEAEVDDGNTQQGGAEA
jgi:hypothetical protein